MTLNFSFIITKKDYCFVGLSQIIHTFFRIWPRAKKNVLPLCVPTVLTLRGGVPVIVRIVLYFLRYLRSKEAV